MNKDLKMLGVEDARILAGFLGFMLFIVCIIMASKARNEMHLNEKHRKQVSYLQHDIEVLRATVKTDIIDREGQLPYNQVAGHLKSLGL